MARYTVQWFTHPYGRPNDRWAQYSRDGEVRAQFFMKDGSFSNRDPQRVAADLRGEGYVPVGAAFEDVAKRQSIEGSDRDKLAEAQAEGKRFREERDNARERFNAAKDNLKAAYAETDELRKAHVNLKAQYTSLNANREAIARKLSEKYAENHRLRVKLVAERREHKTDGKLRAELNKARQAAARWKRVATSNDHPYAASYENESLRRRLSYVKREHEKTTKAFKAFLDGTVNAFEENGAEFARAAMDLRTAAKSGNLAKTFGDWQ